jgi:hypothetical protein
VEKIEGKVFSTSIQLCAGCYYYVRWLENPYISTKRPISTLQAETVIGSRNPLDSA